MSEDNEIILDVNKIDFSDSSNLEEKELWQKDAAKSLTHNLSMLAKKVNHYNKRNSKARENNNDCNEAHHDAIFINGDRGAGKTVFLKNIKTIWNSREKSDEDGKLFFTSIIDPTLLIADDNFTNVVIAHLYNAVESKQERFNENNNNFAYK